MNSWPSLRPSRCRVAARMSTPGTFSKEQSRRTSWNRSTYRRSLGTRTLISVTWSETWEGPRSSSSSIPKDPHVTTRGPIRHPLPLLAAAHQWTSAPQTHTPNLMGRGYSATIAKGLAILHVSAHSHTGPSNSSRPGLHSNKEAIPMTKESMLCVGCPLQKCGTFSKF